MKSVVGTDRQTEVAPPRKHKMLHGKTVLITGASSGLGEHFARLCAKARANVVIAAR